MGKRVRAATATALLAGGVAANSLLVRRGARRVLADPDQATLSRPLDGRIIEVEARDGTRIHAEAFGPDDAPAIVLAHGWSEAIRIWTRVIHELTPGLRVVAWDLRGHGRSDEPANGDYSIDARASDLDAVLEAALAPAERAVVAGHSLGAMTVIRWAEAHPASAASRMAASVLVNACVDNVLAESLVFPPRWRGSGT